MFQKEIVVAPFFKTRIVFLAERLQRIVAFAMKVHSVFFERIVGRKIHAATKPPDVCNPFFSGNEETDIHVHSRHKWVARMDNQRDTHGFETPAGELWPGGAG